ncbi:hypothetical protein ACFQ1R_01490 [Mariniflexile jejuense]|uniref:Secreted protein (Por secretion system target) n=1 Tax=Mariniflexile jejuense TaxID=1173582 RepID=A0ABW3JER5_9FLAO
MKKQITFLLFTLLFALTSSQMMAQKHVLYVMADGVKIYNDDAVAVAGNYYGKNASDKNYGIVTKSSLFGNDPVLKMLKADSNFSVTYITATNGASVPLAKVTSLTVGSAGLPSGNTLAVNGNIDTAGFDLIIATENVSGSFNFIKGGATPGILAPSNLTAPIIYAKSILFKNGSLVTSTTATSITTQNLSMQVVNATSPIFTGITVSNGSNIPLFRTTSDDYGIASGQKAIDVINGLEISGATNTLLATVPEITAQGVGQTAVGINYFPTNTQLGTDASGILAKDAIVLPFSWGATVKQDGGNITPELLTIWRNAAYMLTGQTIPSGMIANPTANSYEMVAHTYTYDFRNGSFINTTTNNTLLSSIVHNSVNSNPVFALNDITGTGASPKYRYYADADANPFVFARAKDVRLDYDVNGDNFYDATRGLNLKTGSKIHIKTWGTASVRVPLDAASNLDYALSVPNINSKSWVSINGVSYNGPSTVAVNLVIDGTASTVTDLAYNIYSTTGNSQDLVLTADATNGGTDIFIPYVEVTYNLLQAKPKEILYLNQIGVGQGAGASAPGADPVITMLEADPNFNVTYIESDQSGTQIPALSGFDLVIVQETFSSGAAVFKPGGKLGVKDVTIPIIYNKSYAFRNGKAVTDANASVPNGQTDVTVTVAPANQTSPLFKGISFTGGNTFNIFGAATASDDGTAGGGTKSIDAVIDLDITTGGESLATTSYATNPATSMVINYLPSGTQLGTATTDKLNVNAVALAFSYGATIMGDGTNISPQALTIWRNAAYMLTGLSVPSTLVANPNFTLGIDKAGEVSNVSSNVKSVGKRIYVSNVKSSTEVNIYSITGALVKSFKTNSDIDFEFKTGLWIATVKTFEGEKAVKLLTR